MLLSGPLEPAVGVIAQRRAGSDLTQGGAAFCLSPAEPGLASSPLTEEGPYFFRDVDFVGEKSLLPYPCPYPWAAHPLSFCPLWWAQLEDGFGGLVCPCPVVRGPPHPGLNFLRILPLGHLHYWFLPYLLPLVSFCKDKMRILLLGL